LDSADVSLADSYHYAATNNSGRKHRLAPVAILAARHRLEGLAHEGGEDRGRGGGARVGGPERTAHAESHSQRDCEIEGKAHEPCIKRVFGSARLAAYGLRVLVVGLAFGGPDVRSRLCGCAHRLSLQIRNGVAHLMLQRRNSVA